MDNDIDAQRKMAAILHVLADAGRPLGSTRIARELRNRGIDLKQRMVCYYLENMDEEGFTQNLGRPGRKITIRGWQEMERAIAVDRVGFMSARIDELACSCTFDMDRKTGLVILNVSSYPRKDIAKAKKIVRKVISSGLGMGRFIAHGDEEERLVEFPVPPDREAIGTICSVTLNGVFCEKGIPVLSKFGGLLELRDGKPHRFTQIIHYDGTTVDPIEIFIKGKMTRVSDAVRTGNGVIGASFREIPAVALPRAQELIRQLDLVGLGGVLQVGVPGKSLADVRVPQGRVGMIIAAGLNPIAALEESGVATENHAMANLFDFRHLSEVTGS